jgi:hypothetical protein
MTEVYFSATEGKEICDFCSAPQIYKDYPEKDFNFKSVQGINLNSSGGWCACKTCADLLDSENWDGMHTRCVDEFIKQNPRFEKERKWVGESVKDLHEKFKANRLPVH